MNKKRKRLNLTLNHFFPLSQYLGAAYVLISWPRLSGTTWLMPGREGPRLFLLIWPLVLLVFAFFLDRAETQARAKDTQEIAAHVKYGGMNRATLLALCTPLMFILDLLAIAHLHISCFKSGVIPADPMRTGALAIGVVLYIYGRVLSRVPFGSIWGIATTKTKASSETWKAAHIRAALPVSILGAGAILCGVLLPAAAAIAAAGALCCAALLAMFLPNR